jgi:hypothetical protein
MRQTELSLNRRDRRTVDEFGASRAAVDPPSSTVRNLKSLKREIGKVRLCALSFRMAQTCNQR